MTTGFTERLNLLFQAFLQPTTAGDRRRREWSNSVVAAMTEQIPTAKPLSRQYVGLLRSGERASPGLDVATAIARAFAELSVRSGSPCTFESILVYLATETAQDCSSSGGEPDDSAERLRAQLADLAAVGGRPDDMVGVLARLGDLRDPASFDAIRALIGDLVAAEAAETGGRRVRRRLRSSVPRGMP